MALEQNNRYVIDVNGPLVQQGMGTLLVQGDQYANTIRVELMDGEEKASISGTTETVVIRPDGSEVTISGSINGNVIETTLQGSCYEIPGMCEIMIRVQELSSDVVRTVLLLTARIMHAEGYKPEDGDGNGGTKLQSKTVNPTESIQTVRPDGGYNGLSYVMVNAIDKNYIGSSVTKKPAEVYTPSTQDQVIEPSQYLVGGQIIKGDKNLDPSNIRSGIRIFDVEGSYAGGEIRLQEKTVAPSVNEQIVRPDDGYNGLSLVKVAPIDSGFIGSGVTRKNAETYTPGTQTKTIEAGQYLEGAQTIEGDSNLLPSNIKSGVMIFGVNGTYTGSGGETPAKKIKTGSFRTDNYGDATVDCGFKPDFVTVYGDGVEYEDGIKFESNLTFAFVHKRMTGTNGYDEYLESTAISDEHNILDGYALENESGFDITMWEVSGGWDWSTINYKSFDYVAVKYT